MSIQIPAKNLNDVFESLLADYESFNKFELLKMIIFQYRLDGVEHDGKFDDVVLGKKPVAYGSIFELIEKGSKQSDYAKIIEAIVMIGSKEAENPGVIKE